MNSQTDANVVTMATNACMYLMRVSDREGRLLPTMFAYPLMLVMFVIRENGT